MIFLKAPDKNAAAKASGAEFSIFLAGGISNCPDWQREIEIFLSENFSHYNVAIFNPRRESFDVTKVEDSIEQIGWEYKMLEFSDMIIFWFPEETDCPITLFELGNYIESGKKVLVGCHKNYRRKLDVQEQIKLRHNGKEVYVGDLDGFKEIVKGLFEE